MSTPQKIVLFLNTKKRTNNDADYTGMIKEGDVIVKRVNLWINTSQAGENYLSGYVREPQPTTPASNGDQGNN